MSSGGHQFTVMGLFAGIGGFERGLQAAAHETVALCESWEPAIKVLRADAKFADVPIHPDVLELGADDVLEHVDLVTAGFPCTDLSQAGRTAGINGNASGLILHVFDVLDEIQASGRSLPTLLLENVPNMLVLAKGKAMEVLIDRLELLGYQWAYRTVDSRAFGVPQRRRRVFLVASTELDPREVLFADDAGEPDPAMYRSDAFGFYWTEGRTGLGWAQDAIPTLKGGSALGIPSPPAAWLPRAEADECLVRPSIESAEALQGFGPGVTAAACTGKGNGPRWKLVGNAVTVDAAAWLGDRLATPGRWKAAHGKWDGNGRWPVAAFGAKGETFGVELSEFPRQADATHLGDLLQVHGTEPLSHRAASGFWSRLRETNLGKHKGFREAVSTYVSANEPKLVTA